MSEPVQALGDAFFSGVSTVREIGPLGMVTLRAAPGLPGLAEAVRAATGCDLPAQRRIVTSGAQAAAWMSPDEWLLLGNRAQVPDMLAKIGAALGQGHHLAVDVSDARAVFLVEGAAAAGTLARLCPVDFAALAPDEVRRTRLAQVACALWRDVGGFRVVTFRSVARYAFDVLSNAAR
jgi:sarcosine oxidase subunit gamma